MIDDDTLQEALDELIRDINGTPAISAEGLKESMFPDDLIAAIHNHLGNTRQLLSPASGSFNASDLSVAYTSAQKELEELSSNLFSASQTSLIDTYTYQKLERDIRRIIDLVSDLTDSEYS